MGPDVLLACDVVDAGAGGGIVGHQDFEWFAGAEVGDDGCGCDQGNLVGGAELGADFPVGVGDYKAACVGVGQEVAAVGEDFDVGECGNAGFCG